MASATHTGAAPSASGAWPAPLTSFPLWPGTPPGAPAQLPVPQITERAHDASYHDRAITGVAAPRIDWFPAAQPNGSAVLLIPGGAYLRIAFDREGYEMAAWFNARGVSAGVLFYRLPDEGWVDRANVASADAQRAVRLLRTRAQAMQLDPARLIVMGFSAGGHVCADLAARWNQPLYTRVDAADMLSARPDLAAPIYPVVAMRGPEAHAVSRAMLLGASPTPEEERVHSPDLMIGPQSPPCFIIHAEDDPAVPVANSRLLHDALRRAKVPVEMHLFEKGGHGFGLRNATGPNAAWAELFMAWARSHTMFG
ncbi:MAG: alpha/beta hydrolase [Alphaproteobacteria bacterium]|nr:alpha/beta hydrolase [Alphaproteobacteria bacterium]MDE2340938.1 alpha/beta hydrolase [Alphaproteobacteria bacterium]